MIDNLLSTEIWAGSQDSFLRVQLAIKTVNELPAEEYQKRLTAWEDAEEETPNEHWLLEEIDGVAIITVSGPMVSGSAGWWGQWMGVVGYDDIRNAIITALNNGSTEILFDWDTPGGSVKGIKELSDFIKSLEGVNITSYTGGQCTSGGVWLGTAADEFYAGEMAELGSVGVIAVVSEITEMLKEEGVKVDVFKSAPLKAVGMPLEKLSEEGRKEIQANIDETHEFFVREIAINRQVTEGFVIENIADGTIWFAAEAREKNVIDGLKTYDEIFLSLSNRTSDSIKGDNPNEFTNIEAQDMNRRKKILDDQAAALIAVGVSEEEATKHLETVEESEDEETTVTEEESTADADASKHDDDDDDDDDDDEKEVDANPLSAQLTTLTDSLIEAKVQLAKTEANLASLEGTHNGLKDVVAAATQRASVALGGAAPDLESLKSMDSQALLVQYAQLDAELSKRFGSGGQVSVQVDEIEDVALTEAAKVVNLALLKQAKI